jgi:hypothetical protein
MNAGTTVDDAKGRTVSALPISSSEACSSLANVVTPHLGEADVPAINRAGPR